jgi:hypothetical protein
LVFASTPPPASTSEVGLPAATVTPAGRRLLSSTNGSDAVKSDLPYILYKDESLIASGEWRRFVDSTNGVVPFLSFTSLGKGAAAERSLDIFTQRVLIPLVVKTSAVVICTPTRACSLGMSFGKAANFLASKYGCLFVFSLRRRRRASVLVGPKPPPSRPILS